MTKFSSKLLLVLAFSFISASLLAQNKMWDPLFPIDDVNFEKSGWYGGAGATYSLAMPFTIENTYQISDLVEVDAEFKPLGKTRFMIEGGRFTMLYSKLIPYIDYGVMYKMLAGLQDYTGYVGHIENKDTLDIKQMSASFTSQYLSAHINFNNAIRISEYGFIQNTLGLNVDYKMIETLKGTAPLYHDTKTTAETFMFQLHYKFGYGLRLDKKHFLIFTIETPILTAYPWDDGKSTIALFNSRYRPIMLSAKLMFLQNTKRPECNNKSGADMNNKRKKTKMF